MVKWSEAPKPFPKPLLHKKHAGCLHGCVGVLNLRWSTTNFSILTKKLLQINIVIISKESTKNYAQFIPSIGQQKMPYFSPRHRSFSCLTNDLTNIERVELWDSCSPWIITGPLTDYHFCKHPENFWEKKFFNDQSTVHNAFEEFINSRTPCFMLLE